jgi:hypothetical protein
MAVDHPMAALSPTALTNEQALNLEPYRQIDANSGAVAMLERVRAAIKAPGTPPWAGPRRQKPDG